MAVKQIYFDVTRCVGCFTCQVACKQENDLSPNTIDGALAQTSPVWRRVIEVESGEYGSESVDYVSLSCMHCTEAPCASVCPTSAISRNDEDGVVEVDGGRCIGCKLCMQVCPSGIPQFGVDGVMQKCNLCLQRLSEGERPACVAACPSKALVFESPIELSKRVQEKMGKRLVLATGRAYSVGRAREERPRVAREEIVLSTSST